MIDEILFFPKFEKPGRDRCYTFELFKNSHQRPEKIVFTVETNYTSAEGEELYDKDRDYYLDE